MQRPTRSELAGVFGRRAITVGATSRRDVQTGAQCHFWKTYTMMGVSLRRQPVASARSAYFEVLNYYSLVTVTEIVETVKN